MQKLNIKDKYWYSNLDMSYGSYVGFKYCKLDGLLKVISLGPEYGLRQRICNGLLILSSYIEVWKLWNFNVNSGKYEWSILVVWIGSIGGLVFGYEIGSIFDIDDIKIGIRNEAVLCYSD